MKITDLRATTVAIPLEAPLRHANGCHWGRFVRTIVEIEDAARIGSVAGLIELDIEGPSVQRQVRNSNHARCAA